MDMTKHQEVLKLIEELQTLTTFRRILTYGTLGTLKLALSRWIHDDVVIFFENYLEKLDNAVLEFNKTDHKVFVNRTTIGEMYNLTRIHTSSPTSSNNAFFYETIFHIINEVLLNIVKNIIDIIYDEDSTLLKPGYTLKSLAKLNYSDHLFMITKDLIVSYYALVTTEELKSLQYIRDNTDFMKTIILELEIEISSYIRSKYSSDINYRSL